MATGLVKRSVMGWAKVVVTDWVQGMAMGWARELGVGWVKEMVMVEEAGMQKSSSGWHTVDVQRIVGQNGLADRGDTSKVPATRDIKE